ncbi:hypothetical protein S4054_13135 [Pseudoalteromonas luteoviolacea]|nr:hypothetical protein S4054_13135 [Pseudoalteromonas luteoviolacea]
MPLTTFKVHIGQTLLQNRENLCLSHLAIPFGYPIWLSHLAIPFGYPIWLSHLAIPFGYPIWLSHLAIPFGYSFDVPAALFSGDLMLLLYA